MRKTDISQRLKELMAERNINASQLASETGLPLDSLKNYLFRGQEPRSKSMKALEQYFGVSSAYLRGDEDSTSNLAPPKSYHSSTNSFNLSLNGEAISPYEKSLLFAVRRLTDEDRKALDVFVGYLLQKGSKMSSYSMNEKNDGSA